MRPLYEYLVLPFYGGLGASPDIEVLQTVMLALFCRTSCISPIRVGDTVPINMDNRAIHYRFGRDRAARFLGILIGCFRGKRYNVILLIIVILFNIILNLMTVPTAVSIRAVIPVLAQGSLVGGHLVHFQVAITAFGTIDTLSIIATDHDKPRRVFVATTRKGTTRIVSALHCLSLLCW